MTKRELKYLFIINYQALFMHRLKLAAEIVYQEVHAEAEARIQNIINDTNQWMAEQEEKINQLVKEHDATWTDNLETIWQEKQEIEEKLIKMKQKRKEQMRYERE